MTYYEPELMYALDSKSEYADWKNVYNVSGSDVLYCPICLGRVKLWNGQDPEKIYKKQKCFHHIDGMCSQESRLHFAYKTWLLEEGSKFIVNGKIYEVKEAKIEQILHTSYGIYKPDIVVITTTNKIFYIEISNTNKKTEDYILKWDELGNDVLELDVNEQLITASTNNYPIFKLLYSAITGECYIKHYVRKEYDDLITERKIYWKRKDLMNYKIQWERLDWFWKELQVFYSKNSNIDSLIVAFEKLDPEDQRFVCDRMRGKHKLLRRQFEAHYTDYKDKQEAHYRHISQMVRDLNKEFGYSSCSSFDDTFLCRKGCHVIFRDNSDWEKRSHLFINDETTEIDIYNYFHPIMERYYHTVTIPKRERHEKEEKLKKLAILELKKLNGFLRGLQRKINSSKNKIWNMHYSLDKTSSRYARYNICIDLLNSQHRYIYINFDELKKDDDYKKEIKQCLTSEMNDLISSLKNASEYSDIRIMEDR